MKNQIRNYKVKKSDVPKVKARLRNCLRCNEVFSSDYPNGADESNFCGECIGDFHNKMASKVKQDIQQIAKKVF